MPKAEQKPRVLIVISQLTKEHKSFLNENTKILQKSETIKALADYKQEHLMFIEHQDNQKIKQHILDNLKQDGNSFINFSKQNLEEHQKQIGYSKNCAKAGLFTTFLSGGLYIAPKALIDKKSPAFALSVGLAGLILFAIGKIHEAYVRKSFIRNLMQQKQLEIAEHPQYINRDRLPK